MNDTVELSAVWWPGDETPLRAGKFVPVNNKKTKITRIWLGQDGNGIAGRYDRIHIEAGGKLWMSGPAHNAETWEYK